MIFAIAILSTTFLAAIWLAADLLRSGFRNLSRDCTADGTIAGSSYAPVRRLLSNGDFAYLADESDLAARLLQTRSAAMRLYLKRIRRDYLEVWRTCRLLAPISPDPSFATELSRQYWTFHWAYLRLQAQCLAPAIGRDSSAADSLVQVLSDIRQQAGDLLSVSEGALSVEPTVA